MKLAEWPSLENMNKASAATNTSCQACSCSAPVVHVLDAWDEETEQSTIQVFADKADAIEALAKLADKPSVYAGVVTRKVR